MFSRTYSAILVNTHCLRQQWVMLSFYTLTLIVLLFPTFVLARPDYSSSYLYISDDELMHQRDYTSMWTRTGIVGWIRTNHDLYSMPPTLNRICDSMIIGGSLQPVRMTLPAGVRINAPQVVFPTQATELRRAASSGGRWLSSRRYSYGLWFNGTTATMWRWRTGTPSPMHDMSQAAGAITWNPSTPFGIFCEGELWIDGQIFGKVGIGAVGNIRLMDNLTYQDGQCSEYPYQVPINTSSSITLISEAYEYSYDGVTYVPPCGVLIANNTVNGRENGGGNSASSQDHRDIAIHGQIIALNGSFTFEDQNDSVDAYRSQSRPDERGTIYVTGSIMQKKRGCLHSTVHQGTGYGKVMTYDTRFTNQRAPFSIPIVEW